MKTSCVYSITNKANGKMYVGSTTNFRSRVREHVCGLNNNRHPNRHIQSAWNRYGKGSFSFEILEEVQDVDLLFKREGVWIQKLKTLDKANGYNLQIVDDGGSRSLSDDTRAKISVAASKRRLSEETRKRIGAAVSGKKHPLYGKKHSEESKEKNRKSNTDVWAKKKSLGRSWRRCNSVLTQAMADEIRKKYIRGVHTFKMLANEYGVSMGTIQPVIENRTWVDSAYVPQCQPRGKQVKP